MMVPRMTQTVAYVRESSNDHLDGQLDMIGDVDRVFTEEASGESRPNRTALLACIEHLRAGDTVRVASMDRLAPSLGDLRDIIGEIIAQGASVEFIRERRTCSPDTDDSVARLMLSLLDAVAECESVLLLERQREGIRTAQAAGKYKGRSRKITDDQIKEARRLVGIGLQKTTVARQLRINRTTLYQMLAAPPLTSATQTAAEVPDSDFEAPAT